MASQNLVQPLPASSPAPVVIHVSDRTELKNALSTAQGGETIVLADGDYGGITISQQYASMVTLVSENTHGARLTGLTVSNAENVTIDGLLLDFVATPGANERQSFFSIVGSRNIEMRNNLLDGDEMDNPSDPGHGYPAGRGLRVNGSQNVLIEDNEIRTFWKAMNTSNNDGLIIRGNEIHDIRSDGLNIITSENVLVEGNHIHDFRRNMATGDHPDMIQIWSTKHALLPRNIVIRDNYLDIGDGTPVQSIFISHNAESRAAHGSSIAFENLIITGNVIVGGHSHGITLDTTNGAVVSNNTLLVPLDSGAAPRISIAQNSTGVVLQDNIAHNFDTWTTFPAGWVVDGNVAVQETDAHLANHYSNIFINAMSGTTGALENLQMVPDSPVTLSGAGSHLLRYNTNPDELTALARPQTGAVLNEVLFDGSFSAGPLGAAAALGATFHWDFGDGTSGTGPTASHLYGAAGVYTTVLTVTLPDGTQDSIDIVSVIEGPDLVSFDSATGELVVYDEGIAELRDPGDIFNSSGALDFTSNTRITLPYSTGQAMEAADHLSLSMRLQADDGGTVLSSKYVFNVIITGGGELEVYMPNLPAGNAITTNANLLDGNFHDIEVVFDGAAQSLTLTVDGVDLKVANSGDAALRGDLDTTILIGAHKDYTGFTGTIDKLDIDINEPSYDMTGGQIGTPPLPAIIPPPALVPSGQIEIGTVTVDQGGRKEWHQVTFDEAIPDARVVMGPLESAGQQPSVIRVRNVTDTGFEFQIDEWDYLDGRHTYETVSWIAASEGEHTLADGQKIAVGRSTVVDYDVTDVDLSGFSAAPTVLAQVSSENGGQAVTARVHEVTADSLRLGMQEQESYNDGHVPETLDWIALEQGTGLWQITELQMDNAWMALTVANPDSAALFAGMQTANDLDTAALRLRQNSDGSMSLRVEEETSADAETAHGIETVHFLELETGSYDLFA